MIDLALIWDNDEGSADLGIASGDLAHDEGLRTAVLISLFTDRRARADDVLPADDGDRRGWWGDVASETPGDRIGSRLWLLAREKVTQATLARARDYCDEALAWMIEDGVARAIDIETAAQDSSSASTSGAVLAIGVVITRPDGAQSRFDTAWSAT